MYSNFLYSIETCFNFIIFFISLIGIVINKNNIIKILMSLEIMTLAINLNFIFFSLHIDDLIGEIFVLFVLTVAAAETSLGLSLLILYSTFNQNKNRI